VSWSTLGHPVSMKAGFTVSTMHIICFILNECLFGCKLCRRTCSVREDKLCPPSLSKSSFARNNSSVGTQKKCFLGPAQGTSSELSGRRTLSVSNMEPCCAVYKESRPNMASKYSIKPSLCRISPYTYLATRRHID